MTTFEVLRNRRADSLAIAHKHGVTSIRVFGSVALGDDPADSDADLLVTTGSKAGSWIPAALLLDLENLLGRRVDIVAVLRNLHTMTETSRRLSAATNSSCPEIEWVELAAFRNGLVHGNGS
jgi:uncharacterized protein